MPCAWISGSKLRPKEAPARSCHRCLYLQHRASKWRSNCKSQLGLPVRGDEGFHLKVTGLIRLAQGAKRPGSASGRWQGPALAPAGAAHPVPPPRRLAEPHRAG